MMMAGLRCAAGTAFSCILPLLATAGRFTASRTSHHSFSSNASEFQTTFRRRPEAGMKGALTPIIADQSSAPYAARAASSSRHRPGRRWHCIGVNNEGRLSLRLLQSTAFQGRPQGAGRQPRNQMPTLQSHQYNPACEPSRDRRLSSLRRPDLWLHSPKTARHSPGCLSALDMPDSTLDCTSPSPDIELFVTSNGKPMPRQLSWRGWLTRPWIKRLYGTILNPSMASLGVTELISSLPVIHASLSASPDCAKVPQTPATCGRTLPESSAKSNPNGSLPKTSKAISIWDVPTSAQTFALWATRQKQACSQRAKLAQATGVAAYSSWPTPTASDSGHFVDLMISANSIQPVKTINLQPASTGQMPLSNAARGWTAMRLILRSIGWKPTPLDCPSLPPVRVTFWHGNGSLTSGLISNPRFYELLMGWPIGWTNIEVSVTGFAAWLLRSRGQLSKLILREAVV